MKKLITILGSTGSIGLTTLKIFDVKKKYFQPYLFSADKNYKLICSQIKKYKPIFFLIYNKNVYKKVKKKFKNHKTKIIKTLEINHLKKISDITVVAIPGIDGLSPTILMTKKSKKMLLANKESIICGWTLIKKAAKTIKTKIIPVDSEHFSIFKLLGNCKESEIKKIYLTASGGPFLNYNLAQLKKVKPKDALKHPKWRMGKKISIDSATLMNKILELIEAQKLFNIPMNKLDILIHPESLVHAILEFNNGLKKFIYHETSMIIPLANAIFDSKVDIDYFLKPRKKIENLNFIEAKKNNFPIIEIKKRIIEYPSTPIIINAVNEVLVDQFLRKNIQFLSISAILKKILKDSNYKNYAVKQPNTIEKIHEINNWAKQRTFEKLKQLKLYV
jgi:1-deoxy-D-xylulose-5-phosphate reductoisomerase